MSSTTSGSTGISAREQRTIAIGATVLALAVIIVLGVLPLARHWSEREALIAARRDRLARLEALVQNRAALERDASAHAAHLARSPQRLLVGRSPALAASSLQSLLQGYADAARVSVSRLDVAGAADSTTAGLPAIPATLSAVGDVYGITELLASLRRGPRVLEITDLSLQVNAGLRAEQQLLQLTLTLRAPYVAE